MPLLKEDLENLVLKSGLVTKKDFQKAEEEAKHSGRTLMDLLITKGVLSERFLAESLSAFFGTPFIDLENTKVNLNALEAIPEVFAKNRGVILFDIDREKKIGKLAMLDPEDLSTINYLRWKLGVWLEIYITTSTSLKYGLKYYKREISDEFGKVIEENLRASLVGGEMDVTKMVEAVPIITILNAMVEHAVVLGASDIHFEPFEGRFLVRYRIDGIMQEVTVLPPEIAPILVARVKVLANLQIDVHNAPQDGRFRFNLEEKEYVDVRVAVIPTFHGEKVEMRILKGTLRPLTLYELGLSGRDLGLVEEAIKKPTGMFLVTGPTGSGKTTTLYSIIGILNTPHVNITTVEDPIEYDISGVNQTQVNPKAGLDFATGLRALVRQNPDIIMVGEIRDSETADLAVNSALTGHLLLSTLHTNDASTAIPRLIDLNVPQFLISSTLNAVVAQRLIRRICSVCVITNALSKETAAAISEQIKLLESKTEVPKVDFHGKGCKACNYTGYRGQVGVFEVLHISQSIKDLIMKSASAPEIRKKAREEGMRLMFEDGIDKIQAGMTTTEEVLRAIRE